MTACLLCQEREPVRAQHTLCLECALLLEQRMSEENAALAGLSR